MWCLEPNQDWEEGHPWLLLKGSKEKIVQESSGFCPEEIVFG